MKYEIKVVKYDFTETINALNHGDELVVNGVEFVVFEANHLTTTLPYDDDEIYLIKKGFKDPKDGQYLRNSLSGYAVMGRAELNQIICSSNYYIR